MPGDEFYKSISWWKVRSAVLRRDQHKCVWCGGSVRGKGAARVDHVQPRSKRPDLSLDMGNLRTLCVGCDAKRHSEKGKGGVETVETRADGFPAGGEW